MSPEERLLVQRRIAAILDYPSVYMGGPSPGNMSKSQAIISYLEDCGRITSATCDHSAWRSFREHGKYCPACGLTGKEWRIGEAIVPPHIESVSLSEAQKIFDEERKSNE